MDILERILPGVGHLRNGRTAAGIAFLATFLACVLLFVSKVDIVIYSVWSFLLTLWLMVSDFGERGIVLHPDVVEFWVAVVYLVGMAQLLRIAARRSLARRARTDEGERHSQWGLAFRQFRDNRLALTGAVLIATLYSIAFLCPLLSPYRPDVFQDGLVTQYLAPLTRLHAVRLQHPRVAPVTASLDSRNSSRRNDILQLLECNARLLRDVRFDLLFVDTAVRDGDVLIVQSGGRSIRVPFSELCSSNPADYSTTQSFLLGTDMYGRDVLSRMMYGSRVSLSLGIIAVLLSVTLGVIAGLGAGYFGRAADAILMRLADVLLAFPSLFLILIVVAVFEKLPMPRMFLVVLVLGLSSWMGIARLVRGEVLSVKEREYVTAARAAGLGEVRILLRHILPNVLTPVIVNATLRIGGMILIEAALSYLSLGVQAPTASWGNIIFEGKDALVRAWWISAFPGLAIVLTVVSFNLVGDGLRDAFDPMLKDS